MDLRSVMVIVAVFGTLGMLDELSKIIIGGEEHDAIRNPYPCMPVFYRL